MLGAMTTDDAQLPPHELFSEAAAQRHPPGLRVLFFTEMWERFSYYGMRTLLVLFMTTEVMRGENGGLGFSDELATAIYGIYTALVYLVALPGGWLADRLLGMQRSVWYGGIVIMCGHFTLAIPTLWAFFAGLALIVIGTGLLKPTISGIVGELYPEGGARRDAGFTIYYMGINLGAFLGPLVCAFLGENYDWHLGFAAAGVGMFFGLVQFRLSRHRLGEAGLEPAAPPAAELRGQFARRIAGGSAGVLLTLLLVGWLAWNGTIVIDAVAIAANSSIVILAIAAAFFAYVFLFGDLTREEKHRTVVIVVLFFATAVFWAGFEQAGSSLNLFAARYTNREFLGGLFPEGVHPAGWYQSLNPLLIIALAPAYAAFWVALARRYMEPSIPAKFALGLVIMGLGFLTMYFAAGVALSGRQAAPVWLVSTYLLHTMGELCLSPVGLSATTKLAPQRFKSQMMGIWFLGSALGNLVAGLLAGTATGGGFGAMQGVYLNIFLTSLGAGLLLFVLTRPVKTLMHGVK
jgi:POT family proton-dependent oligopeptide transporter